MVHGENPWKFESAILPGLATSNKETPREETKNARNLHCGHFLE